MSRGTLTKSAATIELEKAVESEVKWVKLDSVPSSVLNTYPIHYKESGISVSYTYLLLVV